MSISAFSMYMSHTPSINGEDPREARTPQQKEAMRPNCSASLVSSLSQLLQDYGHLVVDGTSTLMLLTPVLQLLTELFEQHLLPRTQTHGFIALSSHPAESTAILQAQFLFDVFQKTPSLKLIHPLNSALLSDMKVFPFKSLKCLELRSVPLHCLRGLRALYSQLEVLICSKCVTTLEEILSLCGGDLSSALPWLELHTLNFSYNTIRTLDDSLQLLNVLKVLDLSHNQIEDCGSFLLPMMELVYLNLSFNLLVKVPLLSLGSRAPLATLILRNNELESINGVEHLSFLQHLDLAFNLLLEHAVLSPLFHLNQLKKLYLEGNPLSFHKEHRSATVQHLSPIAISEDLFLDGLALSAEELVTLPLTGPQAAQLWGVSTPLNNSGSSPLDSSYAADTSDSPSAAEIGGAMLPHRKSKVKVRKASISEPSDTENTNKSKATDVVLLHQQEIARIDSFRDQFGADWLQYRRHLENEINGTAKITPPISQSWPPPDRVTSAVPAENTDREQDKAQDLVTGGLLLLRDTTDHDRSLVEGNMPPLLDIPEKNRKRHKRDAAYKQGKAKNKITERKKHEEDRKEEKGNEEQMDVEVDLCDPIVACPYLGKDPSETEDDWIFLRVTRKHLIEVDLSNGQDMLKMELISLLNIETSDICWKFKDEDKMLTLLQLQFDSIRTDKRHFRYVVLDDTAEISVKTILQILYPVLEANRIRIKQQNEGFVKLQCLKCQKEFNQPSSFAPVTYCSGEEKDAMKEVCSEVDENAATPAECPSCASDHVIILPSAYEREERLSSTPVSSCHLSSDEPDKETTNILSGVDPECFQTGFPGSDPIKQQDVSATFYLGKDKECLDVNTTSSSSSKSKEQSLDDEVYGTFHSSSRSSETDRVKHETKSRATSVSSTSCCSLLGSYRYGTPRGPTPPAAPEPEEEETWYLRPPSNSGLGKVDFRLVDHRLKLYLDVEVFEDNMEEFRCYLQVPVVEFGKDGEFLAVVVISEHRLYMMEITAEVRGPPSRWLQKRATHQLTSLKHLEFGLRCQVMHMEFENPLTSYSLLIRNKIRCKNFCQCIQDVFADLPPQYRHQFKRLNEEEVSRHHRLWPILTEKLDVSSPPQSGVQSDYFYLLVYITQEGPIAPVTSEGSSNAVDCLGDICQPSPGMPLAKAMIRGMVSGSPATLLISKTTLCLVEETHQWVYSPSCVSEEDGLDPYGGKACLKEKHQISCISSVHLFELADSHVQIWLYDETTKSETIWHLQCSCPDLVRELVQWIQVPWEAMFHIKLSPVIHEGFN